MLIDPIDAASMLSRGRTRALVLVACSLALLHGLAAPDAVAQTVRPGFVDQVVLGGLESPTNFAFAADGRIFVAEKSGILKVFDGFGDPTPTVFADLRVNVHNWQDRGLLGLTLHPDFPNTPYVYVLYTYNAEIGGTAPRWPTIDGTLDDCPTPPGGQTNGCVVSGRLSRLTASGNVMTGPEDVMLEDWCQQFPSHSIGSLRFGADGALLVSGGEGASFGSVDYGQFGIPLNPCGDPPVPVGGVQTPPTAEGGALRSQDLRTPADPVGLSGAILRIHPITGEGMPDNPWAASGDPNLRRIVAHGLRNPFTITTRPGTGEIWIGDVGWTSWEEIDRASAYLTSPLNFGWPCYEGPLVQSGYAAVGLTQCEQVYATRYASAPPVLSYHHADKVVAGESCPIGDSSVTGLAFYGGGAYPPEYDGALFFADFSRSCVWAVLHVPTADPWAQGLVAAYGFDEGSGSVTADATGGFQQIATLAGPSWTGAGRFGSALSFDGVGDWVTVDDTDLLDLGDGMTLEAWVYPTAHGTGVSRNVIIKEDQSREVYNLYSNADTDTPAVFAVVESSPQAAQDARGTAQLPLSSWTHLAATYDGATLRLFVDGAEVGSHAATGAIVASPGRLRIGGNGIWGEFFQGTIDEVRIYRRALSAAEIQQDMVTPVNVGPRPQTLTFIAGAPNPVKLEIGPAGDLFYLDFAGGGLHRVVFPVGNSAPTAAIEASPLTGVPPLTVSFDGTSSSDPDPGDSLSFSWDLDGDGQLGDALTALTSFTYTMPGTYQVRLRVTDEAGATDTAAVVVQVGTTLSADRDTMLLGESDTLSNGAGTNVCIGQTGGNQTRRALLRFDLSTIPPGSSITGATLDLYQDKSSSGGGGTFDLHRLLADWGEGTSLAPQGECQGGTIQLGDASWRYRSYDPANEPASPQWSVPGGDYALLPSASLLLDGSLGHRMWTSATMRADVQGWLDDPASNHGWLIKRSAESAGPNALRFASRQNAETTQRPKLTVTFDPPVGDGACCLAGAVCQVSSAGACSASGGTFQGVGTDCTSNPCAPDPTGACCSPTGACSDVTASSCSAGGGTYQGDGSVCALLECPVVLTPFVDPLPIPAVAQPVAGSPGGAAHYTLAAREVQQALHRDLPPTIVWGFGDSASGATYPGPTIEAATSQPVTVDWINDLRDYTTGTLRTEHYLPVDTCLHGPDLAGSTPRTVFHLHGGHVPEIFDGHPEATFLPGQSVTYAYDNAQPAGTLWYHDHALGITRLNVYMGLAGFYLIRDPVEQSLGLPAGEFEIALAIQDRSFHPDGSLKYPALAMEHYFGDTILVNGKVWPYLDVKQGKYRFRILNGAGSRTLSLSLDRDDVPGTADVAFTQLGTEGGLFEAPLVRDRITLAPAERADVVIDFAPIPAGTSIVMTNDAPAPYPGQPGVGVVPNVMKFVVQSQPGVTTPLPATLRPLEVLAESSAIRVRDFTLSRVLGACGEMWTINGLGWDDIGEYPQLGTTEIWRFVNPGTQMHPMHMHLNMFQVLDRTPVGGGPATPPGPEEVGWKDTVRAEAGMITRVIVRFEDHAGKFPYHCHILEHEDHEMMRQFWTVEAVRLTATSGQLSWLAQPGATSYDVVRGDLTQLLASGGDFSQAGVTQLCVAPGQAGTSFSDPATPAAGSGFWYLVRARDGAGPGTYDSGSSSQVDSRDDEIVASGSDCP